MSNEEIKPQPIAEVPMSKTNTPAALAQERQNPLEICLRQGNYSFKQYLTLSCLEDAYAPAKLVGFVAAGMYPHLYEARLTATPQPAASVASGVGAAEWIDANPEFSNLVRAEMYRRAMQDLQAKRRPYATQRRAIMKKELLQQVLEALENSSDLVFKDLSKSYLRELAVNTLREAIAQPEQPAALIHDAWRGDSMEPYINSKYVEYGSHAEKLRAANERIAALREALRGMVEIAELTIGWFPTPPGADGPLIVARAALATNQDTPA